MNVMKKKILITYASKHGGTLEISERISEQFPSGQFDITLQPVESANSPGDFDAVILGVALYMGQWRRKAVKFLKSHTQLLADRDIWIFLSGPTGEGDPDTMLDGRKIPSKLNPLIEKVRPNEVKTFHGVLLPDRMGGFEKWIIKKVNAPVGDFRIWEDIETWGKSVANTLQ